MANPVAVADILRVWSYCYLTAASQRSTNVLNYYVSTITGAPSDAQIAGALALQLAPVYVPMLASDAAYIGLKLQIITPVAHRKPYVLASITGATGTAGSITAPSQACGLASGFTGTYTQQPTPEHPDGYLHSPEARCYMPFPPIALINPGGAMSSPYFASLSTWASTIYTPRALSGSGWTALLEPVVRWKDSPTTIGYEFIISSYAQNQWATQKRRGNRAKKESFTLR